MTGKRVWWYFVAFFGFIAAVNAVMVTLAIRTHSGVVTEHPYEKGLAYNQVVEAEKNQQKLGWNGDVKYENGNLYFSLR
ncbi:MAG: FixH family protein, partial [Rickettsiales bacterium]